jgi:nitric oxide reductase subunit C
MLSKSAARAFFLGGTGICTAAFVLLTVDTLSQLDERSNDDKLTATARHGFEIYTKNNCMGCHSLMGEGAYYAPELTKVVSRRGPDWIRAFLKDPQAMYPGRRKMVKYDFFDPKLDPQAEQNISDVIEFFTWTEAIDLNGFPPEPDLVATVAATAAAPVAGAPASFMVCTGCHSLAGKGGVVGPALDGVAKRYTPDELRAWLKNPEQVKPGTKMPNLSLSDTTISELVTFLGRQE